MTDLQTLETSSPIRNLERAIKAEVAALDPAGDMDVVIALHQKAQLLKSVATELVKLTEAKFVEALKAHGEEKRPAEVMVGPTRYYVGETKVTKPRSHAAIMDTVLGLSGGDESKVAECLSANAWKYGAVRGLINECVEDPAAAAEVFNDLFEVKVKEDLEEGKPAKGLKAVNTQFLPSRCR